MVTDIELAEQRLASWLASNGSGAGPMSTPFGRDLGLVLTELKRLRLLNREGEAMRVVEVIPGESWQAGVPQVHEGGEEGQGDE